MLNIHVRRDKKIEQVIKPIKKKKKEAIRSSDLRNSDLGLKIYIIKNKKIEINVNLTVFTSRTLKERITNQKKLTLWYAMQ